MLTLKCLGAASEIDASLPNLIKECAVILGNSPAHSQRVVLDVFQVRLVSSLSLDKVLSQGGSVTQTLRERVEYLIPHGRLFEWFQQDGLNTPAQSVT